MNNTMEDTVGDTNPVKSHQINNYYLHQGNHDERTK